MRILIVEDEARIAEDVVEAVNSGGYVEIGRAHV